MNAGERFTTIQARLPREVALVAVSKFHPASSLQEVYNAGGRIFGESRAQEMVAKHDALPADIAWHFIGHLQPNKVKYIAPFVSLIHTVDSLKLLQEIDKQGAKNGRTIDCLLELHVAEEATKYGFTPEACEKMLEEGAWRTMTHVRIVGLMCMATHTEDKERIRKDFRLAYACFERFRTRFFAEEPSFRLRSWGMSHDYEDAIQEGANLVRIGTAIFGERAY